MASIAASSPFDHFARGDLDSGDPSGAGPVIARRIPSSQYVVGRLRPTYWSAFGSTVTGKTTPLRKYTTPAIPSLRKLPLRLMFSIAAARIMPAAHSITEPRP